MTPLRQDPEYPNKDFDSLSVHFEGFPVSVSHALKQGTVSIDV